MNDADDVLAHSEDDGEWEDEPVAVERRPAGTAVVSVRVPRALADRIFAEAAERRVKPSDVVREAVQRYFDPDAITIVYVHSDRARFTAGVQPYDTGGINPVQTAQGDLPQLLIGPWVA